MNIIRVIRRLFWRQKMYGNKIESPEIMKELILYFASRSEEDKYLGIVKLMKLLFYTDISAYRKLGHSITGLQYYKLDNGPAPVKYKEIEKELVETGALNFSHVQTKHTNNQAKPIAMRKSAIEKLVSSEEMDIIKNVFETKLPQNTGTISKCSHDITFGWDNIPIQGLLPIEIYLISTQSIPLQVVQYAETL